MGALRRVHIQINAVLTMWDAGAGATGAKDLIKSQRVMKMSEKEIEDLYFALGFAIGGMIGMLGMIIFMYWVVCYVF